jgi:hypothetical protein
LITSAARSSGLLVRSDPLYPRPTGVLTEETMTAYGMATSFPSVHSIFGRCGKKSKSWSASGVEMDEPTVTLDSNGKRLKLTPGG